MGTVPCGEWLHIGVTLEWIQFSLGLGLGLGLVLVLEEQLMAPLYGYLTVDEYYHRNSSCHHFGVRELLLCKTLRGWPDCGLARR